jgi:TRAP-type mannitol/chloroaromatic compound transport system permease large subunit
MIQIVSETVYKKHYIAKVIKFWPTVFMSDTSFQHMQQSKNILADIRLETIFKGIFPFIIAVILGVIILMIFPQIILYLPNLMYTL